MAMVCLAPWSEQVFAQRHTGLLRVLAHEDELFALVTGIVARIACADRHGRLSLSRDFLHVLQSRSTKA